MQIGQIQKIASSFSPFLANNVGLSVIIRTSTLLDIGDSSV